MAPHPWRFTARAKLAVNEQESCRRLACELKAACVRVCMRAQVEGGFVQGMGWLCLEELQWGDKQHPWVRPGHLFTKGPGTYKIPSANDIPVDFRVSLLRDAPNVRAIHSSKVRERGTRATLPRAPATGERFLPGHAAASGGGGGNGGVMRPRN